MQYSAPPAPPVISERGIQRRRNPKRCGRGTILGGHSFSLGLRRETGGCECLLELLALGLQRGDVPILPLRQVLVDDDRSQDAVADNKRGDDARAKTVLAKEPDDGGPERVDEAEDGVTTRVNW